MWNAKSALSHETMGKAVKLKQPDVTLYIELLTKGSPCLQRGKSKVPGHAGGTSGKVACLISGRYRFPGRGLPHDQARVQAVFVHFPAGRWSARASEKVRSWSNF